MKYFIQLALVLLIISAVASALLAFVNGKTAPIIQQRKIDDEVSARMEVMPSAATFEKDSLAVSAASTEKPNPLKKQENGGGMFFYYRAFDADHNLVGYVFTAAGKGYSSTVRTMCGVGFTADGALQLKAIKILEQQETPGLGANCTGEKFLSNFNGREMPLTAEQMYVDKDGGEVRSMTGATITSRAVTNSIREGMMMLPAPGAQPVEEAAPADSTVTMKEAA